MKILLYPPQARKSLLLLLFIASIFTTARSDNPQPDSSIYGFGVQLRLDIGQRRTTTYTLSVSAGVGQYIGDHLLAAYQLNANLYRGGLGNSMLYSSQNRIQLDLVNAFSMTAGLKTYSFRRPIYTWTPNYAQSLSNPFRHAASFSTNFVWNNHGRAQQIGSVCLTSGDAMLGYYNDGMPFNWIGLADNYDRYWTGGGYLHIVVLPTKYQAILRFDKFTGFGRDAFELANALRLRYTLYHDIEQMAYNQGRLNLSIIHPQGAAFNLSLHNRFDVQDLIHRAMRQVYHPNIYRWRLVVGAQYSDFSTRHLSIN